MEDDSGGKDVGAAVDLKAVDDLGRGVSWGAVDDFLFGGCLIDWCGQAEVANLRGGIG